MRTVCIVVPTYRSRQYFAASFQKLLKAARPVSERFDVRILVVLNGSGRADEDAVRNAISSCDLPTELITMERSGQNNATNVGLEYCREKKFDIVQLVDDDQTYGPVTLLSNVEALLALWDRLGVRGLVGSRHLAPVTRWSGFTAWIASLAFEQDQEAPKFCIGGSLCTWVAEFPELPPDEVGVANDAYVCNVFFERYRDLYRATGFMPIVFPKESLIYFNVARNLREYQHQQVRIRYGVLSAYRMFPNLKDELREYFNWKFHCDRKHRKRARMVDLVRWKIFDFLRNRANRAAEDRIEAGITGIEWGVAHSTKKLEELGAG